MNTLIRLKMAYENFLGEMPIRGIFEGILYSAAAHLAGISHLAGGFVVNKYRLKEVANEKMLQVRHGIAFKKLYLSDRDETGEIRMISSTAKPLFNL